MQQNSITHSEAGLALDQNLFFFLYIIILFLFGLKKKLKDCNDDLGMSSHLTYPVSFREISLRKVFNFLFQTGAWWTHEN